MMRLLLDTAVLIFALEAPQRIGKRARPLLEDLQNSLELSAISLSEIAIKTAKGKLSLSETEVQRAIEDLDIRVLPYTGAHASLLFQLPMNHNDPFDRQIIAQALSEKIPVVTPDEKFRLYKGLKIVW